MKIINLKNKLIHNTLLPIVSVILMTSAQAEIITFEFEGVITTVDEEVRRDNNRSQGQGAVRDPKAYSPGDKFSGIYTYDSSSIVVDPPGSFDDFKGVASSMSLFHDTNMMAEATSGSVFYSNGAGGFGNGIYYNAEFSASTGSQGTIEYDNFGNATGYTVDTYTPSKIKLSWTMPHPASGHISDVLGSNRITQPNYDTTVDWYDDYSWTLPAPNYGDFSLEYAQTAGSNKPVVTGKLYSVTRVNNNNCTPAEYIPNNGKLLISAMKIGNKMYDVILKKTGTVFTLTKIDRITGTTCQQAEYIPSEGRIKIPKLTINNKTYKTTLKKTSGNNFKIENISPI